MRIIANRLLAGLAVLALTGVSMAMAQTATPADKPAAKPVRSIPYVSITGDDGRQRHYETNAIPLLFNRACFGWRMYLGGLPCWNWQRDRSTAMSGWACRHGT